MQIKDWSKFQHFKDRRPPWIKLYRDLLDDPEWFALNSDDAKVLVMIWLIASDNFGVLPDIKKISFRLRITEKETCLIITRLSHWIEYADIELISSGYQDDAPEKRREETETEERTPPVMRLSEIRNQFREIIGIELGGGVNQNLTEICRDNTKEAIEFALLQTSTRVPKPQNPFMYFKKILEGKSQEAPSEVYDPKKQYPEGSFFHALQMSEDQHAD